MMQYSIGMRSFSEGQPNLDLLAPENKSHFLCRNRQAVNRNCYADYLLDQTKHELVTTYLSHLRCDQQVDTAMLKQFGVDQNGRFGLLKSCLLFCTIAKRFHLFLSDKHQAAGAWDLLHGEDLCAIFPH